MFDFGVWYFVVELLIAELILLCSYPKRNKFWLRYFLGVAACLLLSYFFPSFEAIKWNPFFLFFKFILIFSYTVVAMQLSFNIPLSSMVATCSAGYAIQHLSYHLTSLVSLTPLLENVDFTNSVFIRRNILEMIVYPFSYLICFLLFGRLSKKYKCYKNNSPELNLISVVTIFICIGLSRFSRYSNQTTSVTVCLYSITCCLLALVIQYNLYRTMSVINENNAIKYIMTEEKKQYEISKRNIELINIKCHDLKHQISKYEKGDSSKEVEQIKNSIKIYDANVKTGNEALDVLLTENSLRCASEGIQLTIVGNGKDVSFMEVSDIYSLFGNALENAYEAVKGLNESEKKVISVTIEKRGDFVSINFSNYFDGLLKYNDGFLVTRKKDEEGYHGFGLKSMKLISEKYNGVFKVSTTNDVFNICISFVRPTEIGAKLQGA